MRGFLGGVSVGALLAAGGLAMLSLSVPLPDTGAVQEMAPEPAADSTGKAPEPAAHDPGDAPSMPNGGSKAVEAPDSAQGPDADLAEVQPEAPETTSADDDLSALAGADTAPAGKPKVGLAAEVAGAGGLTPASAPGTAAVTERHQPQAVQPAVPAAPGSESAVVAATEPAPEPAQESGAREEPEDAAEPVAAAEPLEQAGAPRVAVAPSAAAVQAPEIGSAPLATTLPVIGAAPEAAAGGPGIETVEDIEPELSVQAEEAAPLSPGIGTPVVPLTERDEAEGLGAGQPGVSPFTAHAEPFFNPEDRPLMSIVLIDGAGAVGSEALEDFPYPLTFAIDPEDPQAAEKMAARRAAGFEVLMLADLPREASPQDAETAFEVWRGQLPEAVAILEGVETGVQGNRALADQVAAYAASAGYGLVTQDSGLNTVQKLALRDGVPAGVVFRDFDGAGQDQRAIRRFLDQAAFRAGQEGAVIMLGRLRPDTISALLLWGLQDRAARVALAPVSASLVSLLPGK
ncbi:divergent polysaccharide deacetylase family protein [Leisingera aquaemixtae]|uniref:divergent polysaccharide deacteylase family protein n=1 Tax=Leisingera aquaemixtae TaxID=1396826 RepID=UPI001C953814|nr:divergent polysaccharide deacetylase family protein [Leisingera aquaemixtae]MBY6065703.1 divergent polysaccharide deacetylase family protein [Leisingera aquaemixtae]